MNRENIADQIEFTQRQLDSAKTDYFEACTEETIYKCLARINLLQEELARLSIAFMLG